MCCVADSDKALQSFSSSYRYLGAKPAVTQLVSRVAIVARVLAMNVLLDGIHLTGHLSLCLIYFIFKTLLCILYFLFPYGICIYFSAYYTFYSAYRFIDGTLPAITVLLRNSCTLGLVILKICLPLIEIVGLVILKICLHLIEIVLSLFWNLLHILYEVNIV